MSCHGQIADRMQIDGNDIGQGLRLCSFDRIVRQEAQTTRCIEIVEDRQRLRKPLAVNVEDRDKALRIAGNVIGAFVLFLKQIDLFNPIIDTREVEPDADPVTR